MPYITTAPAMRRALRDDSFCGVILYEGPSALDGAPIVVIVTRITSASQNGKTGDMTQSFIIRSDISPMDAIRAGLDSSICGDCQHRPANDGTCYVVVGQSVMSVWRAYQDGRYARPFWDYDPRILGELFAGLAFRIGTYGDPVAAPYRIWRAATRKTVAINGYTHQWRNKRFRHFKRLCMASTDSVSDMLAARAAGWRSFRVRSPSEPVEQGEGICPASKEAGKRTTCDLCRACGGISAKARISMVIMAHGSKAGRFQQQGAIQ